MALAAALALAFHAHQGDDAFVTFRYAQNLALGRGLVFNPGERLMGSTAPGQALLAAAVYRLAGHARMPDWMAALGVCAWIFQAASLRRLTQAAFGTWGARVLALLAALGFANQAGYVALETNTAVALNLLALWLATTGRLDASGLAFAAAATFRPDAVLFPLALLWPALRVHGRALLRPVGLFALTAAAWPLFAWAYFGTPLPHTLQAKYAAVDALTWGTHTLHFVADALLPLGPLVPTPLLVLVAWPVAGWGGWLLLRSRGWLAVFPLHAGLHFAAYGVLRPFVEHDWHLVSAMVSTLVCFVAGGHGLAQRLPESRRRLAIAAVVAPLALSAGFRLAALWQTSASGYWLAGRRGVYDDVVSYLKEHARPEETLASLEVGYLAYHSDLRMHDLGGLINPLHVPVLENGRQVLDERQFDWLVLDLSSPRPYAPSIEPVAGFTHHGFTGLVFRSRRPRSVAP